MNEFERSMALAIGRLRDAELLYKEQRYEEASDLIASAVRYAQNASAGIDQRLPNYFS